MNQQMEPRGEAAAFAPRPLLFGCAATVSALDNVVRLVQSVRWFGGASSDAAFLVVVDGGVPEPWRSRLRELNASVREAAPGDGAGLEIWTAEAAGRSLLVLPAESIVVRDPWPFLSGETPLSTSDGENERGGCRAVVVAGPGGSLRAVARELDFHSLDAPAHHPDPRMSCDPAVIHYGRGVQANGLLLPTAFPLAMVRIEDYNRRLQRELDLPGAPVEIRPVRPSLIPEVARPQVQIAIVGMHRSGTSTMAGALAAAGCHAGSGDDFRDADEFNERGYFEHRAVWAVDEALLELAGRTWYSAASVEPESLPDTARTELEAYARGIVREFDATARPWLIKDPRLCLTLPFWRPLLDRPFVVLPFRDPLEVARSIQVRNGLPVAFGVALWELYNREALRSSRGLARAIISYEDLVANPRTTLQSLFTRIAAVYPDAAVLADGLDAAVACVDGGLRHQRVDGAQVERVLNVAQLRLYDALRSGDPDACDEEPLSEGAAALLAAIHRLSFSETEARAAVRGGVIIGELPRANRELAERLEAAARREAELEGERKALEEEEARLRSRLAASEEEREGLRQELARSRAQTDHLTRVAEATAALVTDMLRSRTWRIGSAVIRTGTRILRRSRGDSAAQKLDSLREELGRLPE